MKVLGKIDKFYIVLAVILIFAAAAVVVTAKTIFSSFITANAIDQGKGKEAVKVDTDKIEKALNMTYNKSVVRLEVR